MSWLRSFISAAARGEKRAAVSIRSPCSRISPRSISRNEDISCSRRLLSFHLFSPLLPSPASAPRSSLACLSSRAEIICKSSAIVRRLSARSRRIERSTSFSFHGKRTN